MTFSPIGTLLVAMVTSFLASLCFLQNPRSKKG